MNTKFSIIVPVYNVSRYLRDCLDSVVAQTYNNWECVCVDDGSTDGSSEILDEYAKNDSRIKVIHQSNSGVASARNAALDIINGEWFLFLDSDDVWAPQLLETCLKGMAFSASVAIIEFRDSHFPENGRCEFAKLGETPEFQVFDMSGPFSRRWMGFLAPKKAFKREAFGDIREKKYIVGEDLLYMTECALRVDRMLKCNLALYGYRDRATSVTRGGLTRKKVIDHILFNIDILKIIEDSGRKVCIGTKKEMCNVLIEDIAHEIKLLDVESRNEIFKVWFDALRLLYRSSFVYGVQRIRLFIILEFHAKWIWWLLAYLPRKLKMKGIHR